MQKIMPPNTICSMAIIQPKRENSISDVPSTNSISGSENKIKLLGKCSTPVRIGAISSSQYPQSNTIHETPKSNNVPPMIAAVLPANRKNAWSDSSISATKKRIATKVRIFAAARGSCLGTTFLHI